MYPDIPTTSQPSAGVFRDLYCRIAEPGEEILSLHISSGLSGTLEAARLGADQAEGRRVSLWDSLTLSGGQRFQVLAAVLAAHAGWSQKAIWERLEKIRAATEVVFTLETLDYLARGGRIGRVQALAGSLLHIKPVIHVDKKDGKYSQAGRGRTLNKALESLISHLTRHYDETTPLWVTVMHGQFAEQAENLARLLEGRLNIGRLEVLRISPVLGVHTGPGVVGAAVLPLALMNGLE
jgi:DegV family protein with EDD domain